MKELENKELTPGDMDFTVTTNDTNIAPLLIAEEYHRIL